MLKTVGRVLKGLLVGLSVLLLLAIAGVAIVVMNMVKPELARPELRHEFTIGGLTIGKSTKEEMVARYGAPAREIVSTRSTTYEYPDLGLILQIGNATGKLDWYEITSDQFATSKGITVGATLEQIKLAYKKPTEVTPLDGQTRVRYFFGIAYALEFWLNNEGKATRILFFQA